MLQDAPVAELPQASPSTPKLDFWAECKLGEAQKCAAQQSFLNGVEACIPVLSGPSRAVEVLQGVCQSWQKSEQARMSEIHDELRSVTAQLMAARDRAEALRALEGSERCCTEGREGAT